MRRVTIEIICDICLTNTGESIEGERLVIVVPELGVRQLDICADYHGAMAGDLNELARKYGQFAPSHVTSHGRLALGQPSGPRHRSSRAHEPGGAWERTGDGGYRCLVETLDEGTCRHEFGAVAGLKRHQSISHGLAVIREE